MPSFFLKGKLKDKGKATKTGVKRKAPVAKIVEDEEIGSDSDEYSGIESDVDGHESGESIEETAQEKRLRLAKDYIARLEEEETSKAISEQSQKDAIAHRLQEDVLNDKGILQKPMADQLSGYDEDNIRTYKGHQLSVTCLVLSSDDKYIYSGSKDGAIIKWSISSGKKDCMVSTSHSRKNQGQKKSKGHILCLAVSTDGKFLASGGLEKVIQIWNANDLTLIRTFSGHKNSITGLTFRKGTHQLFSASLDRSVKVWNLDEMTYIETLFGHEDAITGIDSLLKDRAVTAGGRDRTVRLWKIPEESQLVFRAHNTPSLDCISMINEEHFVSGADDGSIAVWNIHKKKPLCTVRNAHKIDKATLPSDWECNESWVTSVAAVKNSDVIASGSCDSFIRIWKCEKGFHFLQPLFTISVRGFVNGLYFSQNGDFLVAAIGQEHRLGRWWRRKDSKNIVLHIPLLRT